MRDPKERTIEVLNELIKRLEKPDVYNVKFTISQGTESVGLDGLIPRHEATGEYEFNLTWNTPRK